MRQVVLFSVLLLVIFLVHQQVRLTAANHIINSALSGDFARAEWYQAGAGTGLMLQLFGCAALLTVGWGVLRGGLGRVESRGSTMGTITPLTSALTDLKARELAEHKEKTAVVEQMAHMAAVHSTVLEGLTSGVVTVDSVGKVATCNPAARSILGWQGNSPVGQPLSELFQGHMPAQLTQLPIRATAANRIAFDWSPPGVLPKSLGLSLSPMNTPAGPLVAVLFSDLTEFKRLQAKVVMRRHLAQLGEVSAGIAHEFRNNIGAVLGYARLISHEMPSGSSSREVVDAMMGELVTMEGLIRSLLDFGRKSTLQPVAVAVDALVGPAAGVASADFNMDVPCTVPANMPPLWVDEGLVRQSFINLVRNACEAASAHKAGEAKVSVSVRTISETGKTAPEWVVVSVSDNGPGVDAALRQKIFLPFFTTRDQGTGMGLAQVNKVITAHGGEIGVDDMPGGGSIFRMRLPTTARKDQMTSENIE